MRAQWRRSSPRCAARRPPRHDSPTVHAASPWCERRAAQALLQIVNPFAVARARQAVRAFAPDVALVNMFAQQLSPAFLHALAGVPIVLAVSDFKCVCPIGTKLLPDGSLCTQRAG